MQSLLDPLTHLSSELYIAIIAGIALLIFGRRLYWLAVAGLGAFVAIWLTLQLGQALEPQVRLGIAALAGLVGAIFAIGAQKMALNFAGALLGALLCGWVTWVVHTDLLLKDPSAWPLAAAIIGAFLGLLFAQKLFNATLIVVSSGVGALLLVQGLSTAWLWDPAREALAMGLFFVAGLMMQKGRRKPPPASD